MGALQLFFLTSFGNVNVFVSFLKYLPSNVYVGLTEVFAD